MKKIKPEAVLSQWLVIDRNVFIVPTFDVEIERRESFSVVRLYSKELIKMLKGKKLTGNHCCVEVTDDPYVRFPGDITCLGYFCLRMAFNKHEVEIKEDCVECVMDDKSLEELFYLCPERKM